MSSIRRRTPGRLPRGRFGRQTRALTCHALPGSVETVVLFRSTPQSPSTFCGALSSLCPVFVCCALLSCSAPGTPACIRQIPSCRSTATFPRFYLPGVHHRGEHFLRCSGSSRRPWHRPRECSPLTALPLLVQSLCQLDCLLRDEHCARAMRRSVPISQHEPNPTSRGRPMPTRNV